MPKAAEKVESAHEVKGKKVYLLYTLHRTENIWSRPRAIPFSDVSDVFRHLADLISHQLNNLNEKSRRRIVTALEMQDFPRAVQYFRRAQMENRQALTLDFYWDDRPTVVM